MACRPGVQKKTARHDDKQDDNVTSLHLVAGITQLSNTIRREPLPTLPVFSAPNTSLPCCRCPMCPRVSFAAQKERM